MNEKRCSECRETKPLDHFHKNKSRPDGRAVACKECVKARYKQYYQDNREARIVAAKRQSERAKERDPEKYRSDRARYSRESRRRNPEAARARFRDWYYRNKEYNQERRRVYHLENRERRIQRSREWRLRNIEYTRARALEYRHEHLEASRENARRWFQRNPEALRRYRHIRRARLKSNGGHYTIAEWKAMCEWFGGACLCCGSAEPLTVDHVVPVSEGGLNSIENLQPLCHQCNSTKRTRHFDYRDPDSLAAFLISLKN